MGLFKKKGELKAPPAADTDPQALEVARLWRAHGGQHVSLRWDAWEDPAAWGLMLADLARHLAEAYQQGEGRDKAQTLARIREGFDAEWDHPTDDPGGRLE